MPCAFRSFQFPTILLSSLAMITLKSPKDSWLSKQNLKQKQICYISWQMFRVRTGKGIFVFSVSWCGFISHFQALKVAAAETAVLPSRNGQHSTFPLPLSKGIHMYNPDRPSLWVCLFAGVWRFHVCEHLEFSNSSPPPKENFKIFTLSSI